MKKKMIPLWVLMTLCALLPALVQAQWEPTNEPYGVGIEGIMVADGYLYAAVSHDLKRIPLDGRVWESMTYKPFESFQFFAQNENYLFATTTGYLYRSADNGETWEQTAGKSGTILTANGYLYQYVFNNNIFRSSDDGDTWDTITGTITNKWYSGMYAHGDDVYMGVSNGMFHSSDNGDTWESVPGITSPISFYVNDNYLYVGTDGLGVKRSDDNGQTWTNAGSLPAGWSSVIYHFLETEEYLFIATRDGIFRSEDGGDTWNAVSNGLAGRTVKRLEQADGVLYAATNSGVYRSADKGSNWIPMNYGSSTNSYRALAVHSGYVFGGAIWDKGVLRSSDGGDTWTVKSTNLPTLNAYSLVSAGNALYVGLDGGKVYRTNDDGETWEATGDGLPSTAISQMVAYKGSLFVGTGNDGVFRSDDNGASWAAINNGAIVGEVEAFTSNDDYIFTAVYGTDGAVLYRSSDKGNTWEEASEAQPFSNIYVLYAEGSRIFAGGAGGLISHIYRSDDNGETWTEFNDETIDRMRVYKFLRVDNSLFAGTYANGVFRSDDDGETWVKAGDLGKTVYDLLLKDGYLLAATDGAGVVRALLTDVNTAIEETSGERITVFKLEQNYPNPFNPVTSISFSLPQKSAVSLQIFDVLGRNVATLISGDMASGNHTVQWNAADVPSGVYFYRLLAGSQSVTRKMLLLK